MPTAALSCLRRFTTLPLALVLAGLAGCESVPKEHPLEIAADTQPISLAGEGLFFNGSLKAQLTLKRGRPGAVMPTASKAPREYDPLLRPHAIGGPIEREAERAGSMQVDAPGPALTLRLRLENLGTAAVTVEIRELNSDLGNFAVRPERLTLATGQAAEVDPMISQLGVVANEIPLTLILRVSGQTEERIIFLIKPADAP